VCVTIPLWTIYLCQELSKHQNHFRRDVLYVGLCVPPQSAIPAISRGLEGSLRDAAKQLGVTAEVTTDEGACQMQQQQRPHRAVHLLTGSVTWHHTNMIAAPTANAFQVDLVTEHTQVYENIL
jgi:hypothetical protein